MIENVKRDRLLAALRAAVWRQEGGDLSVGRPADASKLYVDGTLDLNGLVDAVIAALEPVKAE